MIRTNETRRGLLLAGLVVLAAAVGAVGAVGTVGAQDAGNGTDGNASAGSFYDPPADDPLNARFRDCCANTVDSVDGGVLNFNVVYGPAEAPYDVEITASGLSDEQVDEITYGSDTDLPPTDLDRTDIVGMNLTGVPAGEYAFTVSVVGEDAETTVPLEITGEPAVDAAANQSATNETIANGTEASNETTTANATTAVNGTTNDTVSGATANETEMGAGNGTTMGNTTMNETTMGNGTMMNATDGNVSIVAEPSAANASANHTVSVVATGENATGNLTEVTVNYGEANVSFGLVLNSLYSASLGDTNLTAANATAATYGPEGQNLTIGFDETYDVSEGDRLTMTYGGVTNPPEAGNYTVGVAVNNGTPANAILDVGEANESMATTTAGTETTENGTETTETTTGSTETAGATETTGSGTGTAGMTETTAAGDGGGTTAGGGGGGEGTTAAGGPGFTPIAGVVALLAAALVAARRD